MPLLTSGGWRFTARRPAHCRGSILARHASRSKSRTVSAARLKTRADGLLGHDDDGLLQALILQLVERDKHERTALAGRGRGLNEQVLLAPLLIGALLRGPHTKRVRLCRTAVADIGNRNGGN